MQPSVVGRIKCSSSVHLFVSCLRFTQRWKAIQCTSWYASWLSIKGLRALPIFVEVCRFYSPYYTCLIFWQSSQIWPLFYFVIISLCLSSSSDHLLSFILRRHRAVRRLRSSHLSIVLVNFTSLLFKQLHIIKLTLWLDSNNWLT